LLLVAAVSAAQLSETGAPALLTPQWVAWLYTVLNVMFWAAIAALVAVFPDGTSNQRGGSRVVDRVVVATAVMATALSGFTSQVEANGWSGPSDPPLYDNPLGLGFLPVEAGSVLGILAILAFITATVTLVVRTRQATGAERQQHRWVLFPFAVLIIGVPVAIAITEIRGAPGGEWLIAIFAYIAIPICFGVAMTRYHLYDIGKIISRTVTYTIVVAILGLLYFGMVTLVAELLPTQNSLAVAGSTLAAAALFNPLRRRIQRAVDRRFNRSAHEAEVIARELTSKLREPLSIDAITRLWVSTVVDYVQPASSGVWLAADTRAKGSVAGRVLT
jgi:hypothetical protein